MLQRNLFLKLIDVQKMIFSSKKKSILEMSTIFQLLAGGYCSGFMAKGQSYVVIYFFLGCTDGIFT